jgi:hypothetical protein
VNGCGVRCNRHERKSGCRGNGSENTLNISHFSSDLWLTDDVRRFYA